MLLQVIHRYALSIIYRQYEDFFYAGNCIRLLDYIHVTNNFAFILILNLYDLAKVLQVFVFFDRLQGKTFRLSAVPF